MTDRKQIEGTEERAADRGRDQLGFPDVNDLPFLGDPAIVESLVRSFLGRVIDIRTAYNEDKMDGPEAAEAVQDAADQYARIFMGQDKGYAAQPWNSPEQLGASLSAVGFDPDPAKACLGLFLKTAGDLVAAMALHEEGKLDDDTAQLAIDAAAEDGTYLLLGVPQPE